MFGLTFHLVELVTVREAGMTNMWIEFSFGRIGQRGLDDQYKLRQRLIWDALSLSQQGAPDYLDQVSSNIFFFIFNHSRVCISWTGQIAVFFVLIDFAWSTCHPYEKTQYMHLGLKRLIIRGWVGLVNDAPDLVTHQTHKLCSALFKLNPSWCTKPQTVWCCFIQTESLWSC